jgi:hypothetical protein
MRKLGNIAKLIRSKNAGPFELTIDIMFENEADYSRVKRSNVINSKLISSLYKTDIDQIRTEFVDPAWSIKVSIPRPQPSGNLKDADIFGGQQYGPLVDIEIL